jgi:hypothetical protein
MSSAGELTGIAAFEVLKRLGPNEVGMGCVSALGSRVPKHFNTIQSLEKVIVIDGCPNCCMKKIVETTGSKEVVFVILVSRLPHAMFQEEVIQGDRFRVERRRTPGRITGGRSAGVIRARYRA